MCSSDLVVPQHTVLFSRTLHANLSMASPHASREEMIQACRLAEIHDHILSLPDAYDTRIGEKLIPTLKAADVADITVRGADSDVSEALNVATVIVGSTTVTARNAVRTSWPTLAAMASF